MLYRLVKISCAAIPAPWRRCCIAGQTSFGQSATSGVRSVGPPTHGHTQSNDRLRQKRQVERCDFWREVHTHASCAPVPSDMPTNLGYPKWQPQIRPRRMKLIAWSRGPLLQKLAAKSKPDAKTTEEAGGGCRRYGRFGLGGDQGVHLSGKAFGARTKRWWYATTSSRV